MAETKQSPVLSYRYLHIRVAQQQSAAAAYYRPFV
jgi:hypothetical protein